MGNPSGIVTKNPSSLSRTPSPISGNPISNNGVVLPNNTNPKSVPNFNGANPSGNGYSVGLKDPVYWKAPQTAPSPPVTNVAPAIQTTATKVSESIAFKSLPLLAKASLLFSAGMALAEIYKLGVAGIELSNDLKSARAANTAYKLADKAYKDALSRGTHYGFGANHNPNPNTDNIMGQSQGVLYHLKLEYLIDGQFPETLGYSSVVTAIGPVGYPTVVQADSGQNTIRLMDGSGSRDLVYPDHRPLEITRFRALRADGQEENLVAPEKPFISRDGPVDYGYNGISNLQDTGGIPVDIGKAAPIPKPKAIPTGKPIAIADFAPTPLNQPSPQTPSPLAGSSPAYTTPPSQSPASQSPATQSPANAVTVNQPTIANPSALTQPLIKPTPTPTPTPTPNTETPPSPDATKVLTGLAAIAATIAALKIGSDYIVDKSTKIFDNTTPQAQQTNAKQGVCDSMQPNQCGFEGVKQATTEATNPIKAIANENKGLLGQLLALLNVISNLLTTIWNFLQDKIGLVLKLLNNQVVDRAVNMLNLAVNITNLLMLTESAGKALGSIVDAVFALTPLQFENDKGQKTTASSAFGQNVTAMVVNIIGTDNYASLKENLAVGNRIIKSSTNLLNQTSKLLYQQSKQQQKTGIEVANIGNALVDNGVVNQNSYPKMSNSPEANAAMTVEDSNIIQGKLGIFKQGIAGLKKITQEINSKVRLVKGIQKTFKSVTDLVDGESKARKSIRNTAKQEAERKSKFKSIHLRQIKSK